MTADQASRDRIEHDRQATLFVEAGAGAGKTTILIRRILGLIADGVDVTAIAAITFTEKAAGELRVKLRRALADAGADPRFTTALDRLDHAPIGTLHAFARRILNEFPVAAGLPPGFAVLDELESQLRFDERFEQLVDQLLAEPHPDSPLRGGAALVELCKRDKFGLTKGLRRVAEDFQRNWDLVAERVDRDPPPPWAPDPGPALALARRVLEFGPLVPDGDRAADHVANVAEAVARLERATMLTDTLNGLEALATAAGRGVRGGAAGKWRAVGVDRLEALRDAHAAVRAAAEQQLTAAREHRKKWVGAILARWVLDGADERAREGLLEFHDLLVLARRLVHDDADARRALHARYQRLLLDEFQDTDPLQLAIAVRLTADPDDPAQAGTDWEGLRPLPGRLFVVGDPKQSIYRFRRADIAGYLRAADRIGAERAYLTANFRSSAAVIDWVNGVFGELIRPIPDVQPEYRALDVERPGSRHHGTVHVLGAEPHTDLVGRGAADQVRAREAADVAAAIGTALSEGWPVGDGAGGLRPCRPGDITVLLPARTSLPQLEAALTAAGVPYRAENSSVVYTTREIRELLLTLRAADDATDALALVAALRTPLYGIDDRQLYEWRAAGGAWQIWAPPPEGLRDHPVARAIAHVRSLAEAATTETPADLLARLVDERRVLDAALDGPDARDVWRRVRFVVEQARAWSDTGGHGLRRYLRWAALQATEARSADTVLPEHDHDAVRVMTIHAAKGLEFPITIVSGMSTKPTGASGYSVVWPDGGWTLASKDDVDFNLYQPLDEQMSDSERRRLLYVACTRAVDHLVVSLHRTPPPKSGTSFTNAELLAGAGATGFGATGTEPTPHPVPPAPVAVTEPAWADPEEWSATRQAAFTAASRRVSISATALAGEAWADSGDDPGLAKEPVDLDLPPWRRGRYGTAVGRAVHAVLQFCDLATGADIDALAAAQCAAEGVEGLEPTVAALARSALTAPIVRQAVDRRHHRELFVAAPAGPAGAEYPFEGYIDLLVDTPAGFVIVDYKTDQWQSPAEREQRLAKYRVQLAVYAVALERITGILPAGGVLVRCVPDAPAEQIPLEGWPQAVVEARQLLDRVPA